jgi:hypothetical protein
MIISSDILTVIFLIIGICVIIYLFYISRKKVYSQSCGLYFSVYKSKDATHDAQASELLCEVHKRTVKLIEHIGRKYGQTSETYTRLKKYYQYTDLTEAAKSETINKTMGPLDKIYLCIESKAGILYDINTIMFVQIHELTHVSIPNFSDTDHPEFFWDKNRQMIKDAIEAGIYSYVDYEKNPTEYCGMMINVNA